MYCRTVHALHQEQNLLFFLLCYFCCVIETYINGWLRSIMAISAPRSIMIMIIIMIIMIKNGNDIIFMKKENQPPTPELFACVVTLCKAFTHVHTPHQGPPCIRIHTSSSLLYMLGHIPTLLEVLRDEGGVYWAGGFSGYHLS